MPTDFPFLTGEGFALRVPLNTSDQVGRYVGYVVLVVCHTNPCILLIKLKTQRQ